ncbi:MAG TPA: hypothetical protein VG603_10190 [Chitinophagales bacterium]|nr:hypothetical protein [Chitinophagales bacterium]
MYRAIKSVTIFGVFFAIAIALYWPACHAGMVHDFISWALAYKLQGIQGMRHQFGDQGLHPLYHLVFFCLYKAIGLNSIAWFFVFLFLHVFNATLSFSFFQLLLSRSSIRHASLISFFGALFFLISPYQTEPVVWKATIHYLTTTALVLMALMFALKYMQDGEVKNLILLHLCYLLALFSLEIAFSIPLLLFVLSQFWDRRIFGGVSAFQFTLRVVVPQLLVIPEYFLLSKIILGNWIGHYGAAAHLNFSPVILSSHLNGYLAKYLLFFQFAGFQKRQLLYNCLVNPVFANTAFGFCVIVMAVLLMVPYRLKPLHRAGFLLFIMFLAGTITTLNLFFTYIVNVEGDRLTYLASVFILMLVSYVVWQLPKMFSVLILVCFLFFSIKFLHYNIESWRCNQQISDSLIDDFKCDPGVNVCLLNIPDNYRGTYMFRSHLDETVFADALYLKRGIDMRTQIQQVLLYNMNALSDSVLVESAGANALKITFAQWGNWWWWYGKGAQNYSTKDYNVVIDGMAHSYVITFRNTLPDTKYLYQCGGEWREVKGF